MLLAVLNEAASYKTTVVRSPTTLLTYHSNKMKKTYVAQLEKQGYLFMDMSVLANQKKSCINFLRTFDAA